MFRSTHKSCRRGPAPRRVIIAALALLLTFSVAGLAQDESANGGSTGEQVIQPRGRPVFRTGDEPRDTAAAAAREIKPDTGRAAELLRRARYRLVNGNLPGAEETLEKLAAGFPDKLVPDRLLLRARLLLAEGDTTGFESGYWALVDSCRLRIDFAPVIEDMRPVFNPAEINRWEELGQAGRRAEFIRTFWRSRDPDPISPSNPRLVIHYARLLEAERNYARPVYSSRDDNRDRTTVDPTAPLVDFPYHQPQPDLKWPATYELDSRGMMYLRHGPPDRTVRNSPPNSSRIDEIWFYGSASFTFAGAPGSGDFVAVPGGGASFEAAMQQESMAATDSVEATQSYYAAQFTGEDGGLVMEFYQALPAGGLPNVEEARAVVALFDTTWREVTVSREPARKLFNGMDTVWIAANRVEVRPGKYYYALRMDVGGHSPVIRQSMTLRNFPADAISLSGIIFGSPFDPDRTVANRSGADLLPRPSLRFTAGETISVFYEIYGLAAESEGLRSYRVMITVSRVDPEAADDEESFSGSAQLLQRWAENRSNSLTLSFDRQDDEGGATADEHFIVDTGDLRPGHYRLRLEVEDEVAGASQNVNWYFDLLPADSADAASQ